MKYSDLFDALFPHYFEYDGIKSLPEDNVSDEQILDLRTFRADAVPLSCPPTVTFGLYKGPMAALHEAVAAVESEWVRYFNEGNRIYCAFDGDRIASFCDLSDFGTYQGLRVGGPGCVGTVPAFRRQGIGLKMIQNATQILKEDGYDYSFIHYTHVGHWYARLGYETVLKWNCHGIVWEKDA